MRLSMNEGPCAGSFLFRFDWSGPNGSSYWRCEGVVVLQGRRRMLHAGQSATRTLWSTREQTWRLLLLLVEAAVFTNVTVENGEGQRLPKLGSLKKSVFRVFLLAWETMLSVIENDRKSSEGQASWCRAGKVMRGCISSCLDDRESNLDRNSDAVGESSSNKIYGTKWICIGQHAYPLHVSAWGVFKPTVIKCVTSFSANAVTN